ncbi:MAG: hypothetical protein FJ385_08140 [Verrucomicrobia bacterium]|nr:hypothetical protein [Verrucomicrobiota bacterium]
MRDLNPALPTATPATDRKEIHGFFRLTDHLDHPERPEQQQQGVQGDRNGQRPATNHAPEPLLGGLGAITRILHARHPTKKRPSPAAGKPDRRPRGWIAAHDCH